MSGMVPWTSGGPWGPLGGPGGALAPGALWGPGALPWEDKILRLQNNSGLAQTQVCLWRRDCCVCGTWTIVSVAQRQLCLLQRDSCICGTETAVSVAQRQILFVAHRKMRFLRGKCSKITKSDMNQVQVPPFELILCQDVATASRNPLECLPAPKTAKKSRKIRKCLWALGPPWGPRAPVWSLNILSLDGRTLGPYSAPGP